MNIQQYLQRIGLQSASAPDLPQLVELQQQHLLQVPFENLDIHLGKKITLDYDQIYSKVVLQKRGGFCYELNGLFALLLEKLGYDVKTISARVRGDSGRIGAEGDHLALIVHLDGIDWLVDVGFGKFSFNPLKIELDLIQENQGVEYKIALYDSEYYGVFIREEAEAAEDWRLGYLFTLIDRPFAYFDAMCHYQQTSPTATFTKRRMITILRNDGRITLTDTKLKTTEANKISEAPVTSEADFQAKLKQHFGMPYNY